MAHTATIEGTPPSAPKRDTPGHRRPYRVWAPHATRLELVVGRERHPMTRGEDGWWTAERTMSNGDLYGYVIDGEGPLPDPRSPYQPFGVHGLSQAVDHATFTWTDTHWQPPPLAAG